MLSLKESYGDKMLKIIESRYPQYYTNLKDYKLWRDVYDGGREFITAYLEPLSLSEDPESYSRRQRLAYNPAYASSAIKEVERAIVHRFTDIVRNGGPKSYQLAIAGKEGGVDLQGSTMNRFLARRVVSELLVIGRVGIYVDMPEDPQSPYVYTYLAEDILNWAKDEKGNFTALLLRDYFNKLDPLTGLATGLSCRYRHLRLMNGSVVVNFYDDHGSLIPDLSRNLLIDKIPFTVIELSSSLMKDIAKHQVALLNLASTDISFLLTSNTVIYLEQRDLANFNPYAKNKKEKSGSGEEVESESGASTSRRNKIHIGGGTGRFYPVGVNAPSFISPPADPTKVSMDKQQALAQEIRSIVHMTLRTMSTTKAPESADSKKQDLTSLESGLSFIGGVLEQAEIQILDLWMMYDREKTMGPARIIYPDSWNLRTSADLLSEALSLMSLTSQIRSKTMRVELEKQIFDLVLGNTVMPETRAKIESELASDE